MHPFRSNPAVRRQYTRILWMAFVLLVCVGLILTASPANPVEVIASGQQTGDSGYVIENFQVNIELTDANVYRVHQVIDVEFFERSRGIFVNIPLFRRSISRGRTLTNTKPVSPIFRSRDTIMRPTPRTDSVLFGSEIRMSGWMAGTAMKSDTIIPPARTIPIWPISSTSI